MNFDDFFRQTFGDLYEHFSLDDLKECWNEALSQGVRIRRGLTSSRCCCPMVIFGCVFRAPDSGNCKLLRTFSKGGGGGDNS